MWRRTDIWDPVLHTLDVLKWNIGWEKGEGQLFFGLFVSFVIGFLFFCFSPYNTSLLILLSLICHSHWWWIENTIRNIWQKDSLQYSTVFLHSETTFYSFLASVLAMTLKQTKTQGLRRHGHWTDSRITGKPSIKRWDTADNLYHFVAILTSNSSTSSNTTTSTTKVGKVTRQKPRTVAHPILVKHGPSNKGWSNEAWTNCKC